MKQTTGCIPRKHVPCFQICFMLVALVSFIPVVLEVQYFNKFAFKRYQPTMQMHNLLTHKISCWLRAFQCVGAFVSCIFYVTQKIIYINVLASVLTVASMFLLINYELTDVSQANRADTWNADTEKYGSNPVWLYCVSILPPIILMVGCFLLKGETGLVLVDNDQLAFAEEFHHGDGKQLKLYQLKKQQKDQKASEKAGTDNESNNQQQQQQQDLLSVNQASSNQ